MLIWIDSSGGERGNLSRWLAGADRTGQTQADIVQVNEDMLAASAAGDHVAWGAAFHRATVATIAWQKVHREAQAREDGDGCSGK